MKIKSIITVIALLFSIKSFATNLVICNKDVQGSQPHKTLKVFESDSGYSYGYSTLPYGSHFPISEFGNLNRSIVAEQVIPGMTFSNDSISIFHIFGAYRYQNYQTNEIVDFPDSGCSLDVGNDIVGQGYFTGFCAYPAVAKRQAELNAAEKCESSSVQKIGDFEIKCIDGGAGPALQATAIFRCLD